MTDDARQQALREALYCERILAKSGRGVVTAVLGGSAPTAMTHYPPGDAFDPDSGAQYYYHCHPPEPASDEHGHFHCFLRPAGALGPIHHLIALGVDRAGRLARLFTVNRWVTGDDWLEAEALIPLLDRFDVQLATPDYLVNRWVTSVLALYRDEIAELLRLRDTACAEHQVRLGNAIDMRESRDIEVLSQRCVTLDETTRLLAP